MNLSQSQFNVFLDFGGKKHLQSGELFGYSPARDEGWKWALAYGGGLSKISKEIIDE
jgi:hypothetical protein